MSSRRSAPAAPGRGRLPGAESTLQTIPATTYARRVLRGQIVAGALVGLACERHMRDLRDGARRGLHYDPQRARHVCAFFERHLHLPDAHAPFRLLSWQRFVLGSLFGWIDRDGRRRFREAYIESGKGSGKTPMAAGIGLYGLLADDEPDPVVFAAAPVLEQAKLLWHDARRIVEASPSLSRITSIHRSTSTISTADGRFAAVTGDSATKDGPRVHMALVDELHEHRDGETVSKLRKGFKNRRQPLLLQITNAGADQASICYETREQASRIVRGDDEGDRMFAYIAVVDDDDDPMRDEKCWPKANPSLGRTIPYHYLRAEVERSRSPQEEALTLRLNFGRWQTGDSPAYDMAAWDRGQTEWDPAEMAGEPCWVGCDMASTLDLAAVSALFRHGDGWRLISRSVTPERNLDDLEDRLRIPIRRWADEGYLVVCPGDRIDPREIERLVIEWDRQFQIMRFGFDQYNIGATDARLADACGWAPEQVIAVRQTIAGMTWAAKEVRAEIHGARFDTGGDPLLRWQATNMHYHEDGNANCKPMKNKTPGGRGKIDAMVAAIIARECCRLDEPDEEAHDLGDSVWMA